MDWYTVKISVGEEQTQQPRKPFCLCRIPGGTKREDEGDIK